MIRKMFVVSGKFIVPGTRETATLSARVFAENRQQGSKDLAARLQEEFGWTGNGSNKGKAPRGYIFSPDFALMHLQWKEQPAKEGAPIVDEALIAEAVLATGGIVSPVEAPIMTAESV